MFEFFLCLLKLLSGELNLADESANTWGHSSVCQQICQYMNTMNYFRNISFVIEVGNLEDKALRVGDQ